MYLTKGSKGVEVKRLQELLNEKGYKPALVIDGDFGIKTFEAVKAYQRSARLYPDGIVGAKTYASLTADSSAIPSAGTAQNQGADSGYSDDELQLILDHEVGGGKNYYNRFLAVPSYPGYESGLTIGIGIDLRFTSLTELNTELALIPADIRKRLEPFLGKPPSYVKANLHSVSDIHIPWSIAYEIFKIVTIPKYEAKTRAAFPGFDSLPSCVRIALVSLVFNRGALIDNSDRRKEMKFMRDNCIPKRNFSCMANQFKNMARLWKGTDVEKGLTKRRYAEAAMIMRAVKTPTG